MEGGSRIPLTVLGGFLGAGKTTLLNHLLGAASGRRIAVLVNDFGSINVDADLVASHDGDTISLTNGCVCCSIGSGLDRALMRVLGRSPAPEWIVIEASGVSDPGRIAQVGISDPMLQLEGVIVVVDAEQVAALADDPLLADTVSRQIASADVLVLNKTDLIVPDELAALKTRLGARYGYLPTVDAQHGRVALDVLTGFARPSPPGGGLEPKHNSSGAHDHDHEHDHGQEALHPFESFTWSSAGVLSADRLIQVLKQLPRSIIRVKGWVTTDRHGPTIVQLAGRRVRFESLPAGTDLNENQLVYIGIRGEPLYRLFTDAMAAVAVQGSPALP